MGNCTVKGTTVSCSVIGVACDGGASGEAQGSIRIVPETIKDVKFDAPKRVKDIIASAAQPAATCRASGPGRARNTEAFKNLEVLPSLEKGVWRVRLAISSEQLAEILSEQANTEAMIERMRTYAASTAEAAQRQPKCKRMADWMTHCEEVFLC